jgi:DNA-binding NarL/FixJ family response regulator
MMKKIKVLVADDHTIVRKGICSLLRGENDITVVGEAKDGREVMEKVGPLMPDVILLDVNMPLLNGIEVTRNLSKEFSTIGIIILTMYSDEEYVHEALLAGATGFLVKDTIPQDLCSAIRSVSKGESYLSPSISKTVIERYTKLGKLGKEETEKTELTSREREIIQLIAEGYTNREISETLCISSKTVEVHKSNIQKKLSIFGTARLTQYAIKKGYITLE